MRLQKLKLMIILVSGLLISACGTTLVKPSPLPLPVCPDLPQIQQTEIFVDDELVYMKHETMIKIVKRDAMRKACTLEHKAIIESTHVQP